MADDDRLPQPQVNRLMASVLPKDATVAKEARQTVGAAGTVFVHYITHLALDMAQKKKKSTITAEDVLDAIKEAELNDLLGPLQEGLDAYRQQTAAKNARAKLSKAKSTNAEEGDAGETTLDASVDLDATADTIGDTMDHETEDHQPDHDDQTDQMAD